MNFEHGISVIWDNLYQKVCYICSVCKEHGLSGWIEFDCLTFLIDVYGRYRWKNSIKINNYLAKSTFFAVSSLIYKEKTWKLHI